MSTIFHHPVNDVRTTVATPRSAGSATLVVADGSGFGATFPVVAFAVRGPVGIGSLLAILEVTARVGNTLTVSGAIEGTTDAAMRVGDRIVSGPTALAMTEIHDAIHALEATRAPLASPAFTGTPTAPTPIPGVNDTTIATCAFANFAAAAYGALVDSGAVHLSGNETIGGAKTFVGHPPAAAQDYSTTLGGQTYAGTLFAGLSSYAQDNSQLATQTSALKVAHAGTRHHSAFQFLYDGISDGVSAGIMCNLTACGTFNSGTNAGGIQGANVEMYLTGAAGCSGTCYAASTFVEYDGAATLARIVGLYVLGNGNAGAGTVTQNVGILIDDQSGGGTTNVALQIASQGAGASNRAIKTGAGPVEFGDSVILPVLADAAAANGSIYLGSDHADGGGNPKLCRKQGGTATVIG